eukprot:CAMPEP_0173066090 /NCGR_PEP_ID=MMETSP1102-20130122/5994_1 /TAXON_ID=49646 /ORGANISM="Geminigera sp., Strain Caron Lab Isolate" /LENGTH=81 /DNA_ID=CAMNT_0013933461 /DNA_START=6159 /DNA_END=6404 /DNA_ORIENTATION=-
MTESCRLQAKPQPVDKVCHALLLAMTSTPCVQGATDRASCCGSTAYLDEFPSLYPALKLGQGMTPSCQQGLKLSESVARHL